MSTKDNYLCYLIAGSNRRFYENYTDTGHTALGPVNMLRIFDPWKFNRNTLTIYLNLNGFLNAS